MKGIVISAKEVEIPDRQDKTKKVKLTKVSVLKEDGRVKEVFLSDNKKGFRDEMVVDLFNVLEDQDYVDVELTEDYTGKSKVQAFREYKSEA